MDDIRSNPDRELVDAVLANRPGAFERLVRVHQCLHQYRGESALKSWIGRVAYTIALRHLQHRRIALVDHGDDDGVALVENLGDGFDLEAACADEETARLLHAAIEALPPLQRTLLTLYYLEETTIPEIARITGLASGTIKSHLFRSRLRLRGALEARTGVAA